MNRSDCFFPLKEKAKEIIAYAHWLIAQDLEWTSHFGFDALPINSYWIKEEPALAAVHEVAPIKQLGLLRVAGSSMYDWHVDQHRLSCINLLISDKKTSHTLFGKQRDLLNKDICELEYQPNTYYLFNNQINHCVINLEAPRYLVSLYFENETSYSNLKTLFAQSKIC